jgi:chaperone modulatory protein CbpM
MTTFEQIVEMFDALGEEDLMIWIERGWVKPDWAGSAYRFSDTDMARVRLIWELHYELNIQQDALPTVLTLLDQVYGLRHQLRNLSTAVAKQPASVRSEIVRALKTGRD